MSTFEATLHQLPKPLLDKLRAIIGRVRRLLFIRGFFATLAVALACLLIIMAIDASVTLFSSAARWALSLTGLAITALTAWWFLIRPLSRRFTLTHIARILEIRHPELQERISTAVELMSSQDPDSVRGSQELIGAVVDSAVVDVNKVDPKTEFQGRRASRVMLVAGVAAALFLVLFAIFPRHIGVLAARAFAPFMDIGNAWSDTLTVKPGDIQVAIGQAVTIEMTVKHDKMRRADLRRKLPDGTESVERMQFMGDAPDGAKRFAVTFPAVDQSFDYRIRAGSAVSEFFSVEAVPKPAVEKLSFRYEFPAYTKREPVEAPSENGEIATLAHSKVTVIAATNKPVTEANFQIVGQEIESQPVIEPGQVSWSFTLAPKTASRWRAKLKDGNGFESDPIDYPVTALPDRAPQIKIVSPAVKELKLRPTELVPVKYDAAEDIGLADVTMLVAVEGEAVPREIAQPKPESDGQAGTWHGAAELNLASLNLQPNQKKVVVQLRARDTLPTEFEGPNQGLSDKLTIIIDNNARTLAEQTLAAQKEEIRKAIDSAKQELAQAKQEAQQAERELAREEKVNPQAMRELDEFRERANKAQETLRQVAQRTEDTVFEPQGEQLEKVADTEVAEAREAADMIPVSDKREERVAEAKTAQKEVDKAITELAKIEKTLNDADKEMKTVAELSQLANEQRQLAQKAQQQAQQQQQQQAQPQQPQGAQQPQPQMTPEQMKQLAQFQAEQARIQQQLGEKLKDSPKALRDILAQQQQEAAQLAQQAKQAAQEQTDLQKMAEAAAAQNNPDKQEALKEQLMASLEQRQQQIAQETGQLKEQLNQQQAQAGKPLENAAQETQQAAESLQQKGETAENMQAASQAAKEASKALSQASEQAEKMAAQQEQQAGQQPNQQQMAQANQPQPQPGQPQPQPGQPQPQPGQPQPQPGQPQPQPGQPQPQPGQPQPQPGQPQQQPGQPQPQPGQPQPQQVAQNEQPQPGKAQPQPGQPQPQPGQPQSQPGQPQSQPGQPQSQPGQPQPQPGQPQPQPGQPQPQQMAQNQQPQPGQAQPQPGEPQAQPGQPQPGDAGEPQQPAPSPLAAEPARQQLAQLAQEQEMIAEQLEAIQAGDFQAALGLMEQQVGQEAQEIGEGAETLAQATQAAQQAQAAQRAATAERALETASQQAQQAAERLANTQMAQNAADQAQGQAQQAQAQQAQAQAQAQEAQAQAQKAQPGQAQAQAQAAAQQAQARAQQAQTAANQAQAQAKQAQGQAQQMASQSSGSQQQAQSNLNQAAQSLEQTAQSLAQALQNMKATPEQQSDVLNPQNLSEAFSDTGESAQSQNAQQAAQNAQQAAQSLQELAQAAMQQLAGNQPGQQPQQGNPQQPGQQPQQQPGQFADNANPQLNESGQKNADINGDGVPPELKALGITAADWSRLKGNLQSGAAAQGGDDLPGEYRDLVGRYFQVIAREAAKSESK